MAEWIPHWPAIVIMARHGAFCVAHCYFMSYWSHTPTKFTLWVRAGFCVPLNCTCPFKHKLKQCNPETILCNCMKPKIHSIMLSGSTSKKVGGDFGRAIDAVDSTPNRPRQRPQPWQPRWLSSVALHHGGAKVWHQRGHVATWRSWCPDPMSRVIGDHKMLRIYLYIFYITNSKRSDQFEYLNLRPEDVKYFDPTKAMWSMIRVAFV